MPVETRLDGDPGQMYATARWLREELGFGVSAGASTLRSAGADAVESWRGTAGTTFHGRMAGAAAKADALHGEIQNTAGAFTQYADRLAEAQGRMARAREIAVANGLNVSGQTIMEPGGAPDASSLAGTADGGAAAMADHQRKVQAYHLAQTEVEEARTEMAAGTEIARRAQNAARGRPLLRQNDVLHGGAAPVSASKPAEPGPEGRGAPPNGSKPTESIGPAVAGGAESIGPAVAGGAEKPTESVGPAVAGGAAKPAESVGPAVGGGAEKPAESVGPAVAGGAQKPAEQVGPAVGGGAEKPAESVGPAVAGGAAKPVEESSGAAGEGRFEEERAGLRERSQGIG